MEKTLNQCPDFGPFEKSLNIDPPQTPCPTCPETATPTQTKAPFFEDIKKQKTGLGFNANCDPMQAGHITQDFTKAPTRETIYRYSKAQRACDEAMTDLFRDIIVLDEQGVAHPVPIIWATQERAVAAVIQTNVRKDDGLVVDRIRLPMLAISSTTFAFDPQRYTYHKAVNYFRDSDSKPGLTTSEKRNRDTIFGLSRGWPVNIGYQLTAWTLYLEDMNQILEQIALKFSLLAYINVQGVQWETVVRMDSVGNAIDLEPGDQSLRVIKYQFDMTAETYIPQPITRKKSVLQARVEFVNSTEEKEITEILARLEVDAK